MYDADKNLGIREDLVQQVFHYSPGGLINASNVDSF